MAVNGSAQTILAGILLLKGLKAEKHRLGATEIKFGTNIVARIHGDYMLDITFPRNIRDEIVSNRQANPHHFEPESGWVSIMLNNANDIERGLNLLKYCYDINKKEQRRKANL